MLQSVGLSLTLLRKYLVRLIRCLISGGYHLGKQVFDFSLTLGAKRCMDSIDDNGLELAPDKLNIKAGEAGTEVKIKEILR